MSDTRYPYTYAADNLREQAHPRERFSRSDASRAIQALENRLKLDAGELAKKLADYRRGRNGNTNTLAAPGGTAWPPNDSVRAAIRNQNPNLMSESIDAMTAAVCEALTIEATEEGPKPVSAIPDLPQSVIAADYGWLQIAQGEVAPEDRGWVLRAIARHMLGEQP
ncbi:hypothetical protein [Thioalkalivibrio sp. ALE19]|uniref:hypothetical protein n=1 Tax=Thioalkalivibrio sp. ALE19 TaxID=1266909 RepID=UPI000406F4C4|nr:hypothetical protein [Thioalkalivibrio sp. ALE19]